MGKKIRTADNYILAYYQAIQDGSVCVGEWVRLLYGYIVKALDEKDFYFDNKKANAAVDWIEAHCFHTEGVKAPGAIELELWQRAMISCIFGLVDENGVRQFREVVFIVARKNGKSLLASAIGKYMWLVDGGYGAKVYCLAPKLEQADIIYSNIWQMALLDPEYQAMVEEYEGNRDAHNKRTGSADAIPKRRQSDLYLPSTNSTAKKIAFSAKKSDGFNPSLTICDEIASWEGDKGLKQYEVMKSGMGARPEALLLSCSTSGYISDSIYDELVKRSTRFLMGESKEKRLLPFLYMIDDMKKWNDINELRKSNPNLGVSVTTDYMIEEIAVAEGSLSKKSEFITKYCNLKQNSSLAWLRDEHIKGAVGDPLRFEDFRECYAIGGIDLSRTTDLTACVAVVERGGVLNVFAQFFLPSEKLEEATARDGLPYAIYAKRGLLKLSGDNFVDYADCHQWFLDLVQKHHIYPLKVGYDRYNALQLTQQMERSGFHMDDVYQGFNLTPVINEFEGLIKDGRINIGDNDLLRVHLLDTAVKVDTETEKKKIIKLAPSSHIDGAAALLDAMTVRQKYFNELGSRLQNER